MNTSLLRFQTLPTKKRTGQNFSVSYLTEKGSRTLNEDAILIKKNTFGVFDGASSFTKYLDKDEKTGAFLAANIAKDTFLNNDGNLTDLTELANQQIKIKMEESQIDTSDKLNIWSTTAAVIKIDVARGQFSWIQIGDSPIIIIYKDCSYKLLIEENDHDRETLILWKKLSVENNKNKREIFDNQKFKVRRTMNELNGYGVLNGDNRMIDFLNYGVESLKNIKSIVCLTDGLFIPNPHPEKNDDFDTWVNLYTKGGLCEVKDYVCSLEETDPDLVKYPRFKLHDDSSAVAVDF